MFPVVALVVLSCLVSLSAAVDADTIPQPRIIGGTQAAPNAYPWFATSTGNTKHFCGASLIWPDVLITAAHCNEFAFEPGSQVLVGAYQIHSSQARAVRRTVVKTLPMKDFTIHDAYHDFMLILLNESVTDRPYIALNTDRNLPAEGQELTVMGFGRTDAQDETSKSQFLQQVSVLAANEKECLRRYLGIVYIDFDTMLCAGGELNQASNPQAPCRGDSGGPLIALDRDNNPILVGIVSFSIHCASTDYPDVYSRVSGAVDWIRTGVCALSQNPPQDCANMPITQEPVDTIRLVFDCLACDWKIQQGSNIVKSSTDSSSQARMNERTFYLRPGPYSFVVLNNNCQGLDMGHFEVWYLSENNPDQLLVDSESLTTFCRKSVRFIVPE